MAVSADNDTLRQVVEKKLEKYQEKADVSEKLDKLQRKIEALVLSSEAPIQLDSFWGKFKGSHKVLPKPSDFGLSKRQEFLTVVKSCTIYTGQDGRRYITALQSQDRNKLLLREKPDEKKETRKQIEKQGQIAERQSQSTESTKKKVNDKVNIVKSATKQKKTVDKSAESGAKHRYDKKQSDKDKKEESKSESQSSESVKMAYRNPFDTPGSSQRTPRGQGGSQGAGYSGYAPQSGMFHAGPPQHIRYEDTDAGHHWQGHHARQHSRERQIAPQMFQSPHASHHHARHQSHGRQNSPWGQDRGWPALETKRVTKEEVSVVAEDCIDRLVEAKELVSPERVEKLLLDHYKVENLSQIGIRYLEHIKALNELIRAQARVNAYIQAFIRIRAIASLYELSENLRDYSENKQDFETLRLGPLTKQPLVYEYFKFPGDTEIPQIDTAAILDQLRNYMTENSLWSAKLEMEGFMSYLAAQFEVDSPYELGIKIKSLPLAAGVLKKSQRDVSQSNQAVIKTFNANTEETVAAAFRNFTSSIFVEENGLCTMRRELLKMSASKVLNQVFSKLNVLQSSLAFSGQFLQPKQSKTIQKSTEMCKQFANMLKNDSLFQNLFKMAVCCSWEETHNSLQFLVGYEGKPNEGQAKAGSSSEDATKKVPRPRTADVVAKLLSYLERCFRYGSLNLTHLARMENKLLEEFTDFNSFSEITNKTFLDFIINTEDVKMYLEENGGVTLGTAGGSGSSAGYQAALHDLHDFILQAALCDSTQVADLERALCWHYHVPEVKMLGHGSAASLQAGAKRNQRHNKQQHVCFEVALCAKESQSTLGTNTCKVGLLGHQVRETAALCLYNCPLLADMAEWSHWDLIFKPELGELKDFVHKNGGVHNITVPGTNQSLITKIVAMETRPGTLLKLTGDTSNDMFASAAVAGDVIGTCGHLASLVAASKGIQSTPVALLGNHLKTGLLKIQSATPCDDEDVLGNDAGSIAVGNFVVQCLTTLPFVTCQAVASQVFIEPLSDVVGQTKSRELLLRCATTDSARSRLQVLGLLLGIDTWSATFQQRLKPPPVTLAARVASVAVSARDQDIIELSSSEDESDDEKSDFLNSSDESDMEEKPEMDEPEIIDISKEESMVIDLVSDDGAVVEEAGTVDEEKKTEVKVELKPEPADGAELQAPPELDEATRACWEVIEDIRRAEFGINVTLSSEGEKLMKKQQERLGRSLDRLSSDLYSKDTHFVLELIQNADDNQYPREGGNVPSIKFIVESERITVLNNENGFEERNIRAICDVGKSTKGKHKAGYIGQKGIGFKSVFRVTDCPQIHSNGYHFRFDLSTGPQGYILPHWTADIPDQSERWMTRITLPLKQDLVRSSKLRQLAARFQDVHPSLLLFLHRLRSITVINKIGDYKAKMERRDVGNGMVEIRHMMGSDRQTTKTDRWLVAKKVLDASHISSQAKSGVEVESTEIALAFPLHEVDDSQSLAPKQPVFAFLPLRSYGFRFVIQGDFDVPSSREDVDRDSMWNQWLQSEIHSLFVEALQIFKEQRNLSAVEAVCLFVKFIPLEDEILDFFRPVATQILQRLRSEPCLPADAAPGQVPAWRLPSQLIFSDDSLLRDIATPELLQNQLGLSYLHHDVASRINSSLLSGLGVQVLNSTHLMEVGRALTQSLSQASAADKPSWIKRLAKWFAAVFRTIDEFNVDKKVLSQIEALPIIPLSNGEITCLKDNAIFFPLGAEETEQEDPSQDLVVFLEKDLNTVDSSLFAPLDELSRPQAWRLLEMLGVRRLQPSDIINHHILPALRKPAIMTKPTGLVTAYFVYIKEELDRQPNLVSVEELREIALLHTNQGLKRPAKDDIHFTPAFGNTLNLEMEMPGYDWVLIDPIYLMRCKTSMDIQTWHTFLSRLGVHNLLAVREENVTVARQEIAGTIWSEHANLLPSTENELVVKDYDCPQFLALVTENTHRATYHRQMQVLFDILDSYWETNFAKCITTKLKTPSGVELREVQTTFAKCLRGLRWLPALEVLSTSDPMGRAVTERRPSERLGTELFQPSMMVERLLAHHVPYLHTFKTPRSELCGFLGVTTSLSPELLQQLLVRWSMRTALATPSVLVTSMAHIKAVYNFLHERLPPKDLQDLFHHHPVLFVPRADPSFFEDPQELIEGQMLERSEVRWNDPTGLFNKYKTTLQDQGKDDMVKVNMVRLYRDLEDVLLRSARVPVRPTLLEYADLITALSNSCPVQQVLPDILQLFSLIGSDLEAQTQDSGQTTGQSLPFELQQVVSKLKPQAVFPTKGNKWSRLSEHPLLPDDKQTERLFNKKEGVHFLVTGDRIMTSGLRKKGRDGGPKYNEPHVVEFYRACGAINVSEVLVSKYVTESFQMCPPLHRYTAAVLPFIQALLFSDFPEIYEAHQERKIAERLATMKIVQVAKLEVVYHLKPLPDVVVVLSEVCKWKDDEDEFTFYVHKDSTTATHEINKELSHYFSRGEDGCMKEIRLLLMELMPLVRDATPDLEDFVKARDIGRLPEEEVRWKLPPPPVIKPPQPPPLPPQPVRTQTPEPQAHTPTGDRPEGMMSWPPRSDPSAAARGPMGPPAPRSTMWPPPAPPGPPSRPDLSQLPHGLRPARADLSTGDQFSAHSDTRSVVSDRGSVTGDWGGAPGRPSSVADDRSSVSGDGYRTSSAHHGFSAGDGERRRAGGEREHGFHEAQPRARSPEPLPPGTEDMDIQECSPVTPVSLPSHASPTLVRSDSDGAPPFKSPAPVSRPGLKRVRMESGASIESIGDRDQPMWFDVPAWADQPVEEPLEEIACTTQLPKDVTLGDGDGELLIGRWGEHLVYNYLLSQKEDPTSQVFFVKWVNEEKESELPFDCEVHYYDEETQTTRRVYVEVKTTRSNKKTFFPISINEVQCALQHAENYELYRVFNAGNQQTVRLTKLENLAGKIEKGQVRLCLVI